MSKQRIALFTGLAILPIVLALWLAGFDVTYQLGTYVVSDNAVITGDIYQASAPAAGQINDLLLDVGDPVERGQGLASLLTGVTTSVSPFGARAMTNVRSPAPGTVVHLNVVRGQTVSAGQSVATVADLSNLWILAQVEETSFKDVRPGMRAEIKVPALDRYFNGEVVGVIPELGAGGAATRAPAGPNAARVTAVVPVRLRIDYGDALIYPGMTASVRIFLR
ncbi:MAG: HlyD family efflux transporter periplasmic adaptor subunit [Chloroflexota bacterium]|nr:MAG: HlyD family efflux transporter periplasmic adaptor subunit [Chloroflexota bacterium]